MDTILSVCLGIALSAACGFRVFVPLLVMSIAARAGHLTLSSGFEWAGSTPALITLSVATAMEIAAYYIPWLDNLLDAAAAPLAVIAGISASAAVATGLDPYAKWTLAVIAGGGAAGTIQLLTTAARQASTITTGGLGNPVIASIEAAGSILLSLLAILAPFAAVGGAAAILVIVARKALRRRNAGV